MVNMWVNRKDLREICLQIQGLTVVVFCLWPSGFNNFGYLPLPPEHSEALIICLGYCPEGINQGNSLISFSQVLSVPLLCNVFKELFSIFCQGFTLLSARESYKLVSHGWNNKSAKQPLRRKPKLKSLTLYFQTLQSYSN